MIKYEGFVIPKCEYCGKEIIIDKNFKISRKRKTCGSKECLKIERKNQVWSDESKEKQRKNRFRFLSDCENRKKTAWHKKAKGELSYGENYLNNIFIENNIYEKYDVINEYPVYPYFIDFAFVNEMVAVEFDGACHFKNGFKRIDHDIQRDEYLKNLGWRIYRIAYFEIEDFSIRDLVNFLGDPSKKQLREQLEKYKDVFKVKEDKGEFKKREANMLRYEEEQLKLAELILSSDIDFSKFGWVSEVSVIIKQKHQKVSKWMKRFLPEFYESKCFKRNQHKK